MANLGVTMTVCFVGFGGIAQAIARGFKEKGVNCCCVSRIEKKELAQTEGVEFFEDIDACLNQCQPDLIIHTVGMLHCQDHQPEKSINQVDEDWFLESMKVNVFSFVETVQSINRCIPKSNPLRVIAFSARVSSLSDNKLGGWHSYRMSKIALNMLIKNIALEWSMARRESLVVGYHPGTVDTSITAPFRQRVKPEKLFSPSQAAGYFLEFHNSLGPEQSGKVFTWENIELLM